MPGPYPIRIAALRAGLKASGLGGAILSRPQHVFYFSGQMPGKDPGFLLVTPGDVLAVSPAELEGIETFLYSNYDIHKGWFAPDAAVAALERALLAAKTGGKPMGIEQPYLAANYLAVIAAYSSAQRDLGDLLWNLRKIRDAGEMAQVEANVAANDRLHADLRGLIRPGAAEYDLWSAIYRHLCAANGGPVEMGADLGAGLRGVRGDAKAGPFVLETGDAVFLDVYTCVKGYFADTTRSYVVGAASAKQREVHAALVEALAAGEALLRPGARACDVDAAVRGAVDRAGFGAYFPHHSGHATSIFQQDKPYFIPAEPTPLEAGMVVTLEPGIYIPGWGGMRLERNYFVEANGPRTLDRFPLDLCEC